jgi:hypothetical protein
MTTTTTPVPLCRIRVIATTDDASALVAHLAEHAHQLLGDDITCRTHTRSARRTGYICAYLTITRKEPPDDNHHG